ncbi:Hypothetical protein D9617_18g033830 [Elsinoe fawcettii]|nr:Hypothetical protein D9617_18g033830 [Elsinoe fawcettii]
MSALDLAKARDRHQRAPQMLFRLADLRLLHTVVYPFAPDRPELPGTHPVLETLAKSLSTVKVETSGRSEFRADDFGGEEGVEEALSSLEAFLKMAAKCEVQVWLVVFASCRPEIKIPAVGKIALQARATPYGCTMRTGTMYETGQPA